METEHTTCILGAPGYGKKCIKSGSKVSPGPPIKSALKGGWGVLGGLRSDGGWGGVWILKSEFELYSVNCIAAKNPGCPKYM